MANHRDQAADLTVFAVVVGVGFLVGSPLLAAVVTGLGVNLLTPHADRGWSSARRRLLGAPDPINHDIERALRRSFVSAVGRLKKEWFDTHPRGIQLQRERSRHRDDYDQAVGLFEILSEGTAQLLTLERLHRLAGTPAAMRLLDGGQTETRQALAGFLTTTFEGHDPQLVELLGERLFDALAFCFAEDLKTDKTENNRSWRAFQRLMLNGLTDSVGQIRAQQADLTKTANEIQTQQEEIAKTVAKLDEWTERLANLPPETRQSTGENGLTDLLLSLHEKVIVAVREEGKRTRTKLTEEIWIVGDLIVSAVEREGERNRALVLASADTRAAGSTPRRATPRERGPNGLPPVWNVPHQRNPNFTGRVEHLARLAETIAADRPAALAQALYGLGGVGKTQLAVEFVYRYAARYDVVWWVRSEQSVTLAGDLADLAGALDLPEAEAVDQNEAIAAVRRHLERAADRWLLVFDNAVRPEDLRDALPRAGGHVIVTSRNPAWHGVGQPVEVDTLPAAEAVAFLATRTGRQEPEAAAALAEELDGLPLALEQTGAYVVATGRSLAWYVAQFRARRSELVGKGIPATGYQGTVATTWNLAFEQIAKVAPAAHDLLSLCAFLAPDDIPLDLLAEHAELLPEPLATTLTNPLDLAETIEAIRRFSLIEVVDDTTISIHRLVQLVARERLGEDEKRRWITAAVAIVNRAFPFESDDVRTWPTCARLLPHATALSTLTSEVGVAPHGLGRLLSQMGLYLQGRARYTDARACYERALTITESALGPAHPTVAIGLNNLAGVLWAQGDLAGARSRVERALVIDEAAYGPDHPDVATALNNLASVLRAQGDLARARSRFERALAIREAMLPGDHPYIAQSHHHLAVVFHQEGMMEAARRHYERALAIYVDREMTAEAMSVLMTLGDLHETAAEPALAAERFRQALDRLQVWRAEPSYEEGLLSFRLGRLAVGLGRPEEGLRLLAGCYVVGRLIGHADAETDDLAAVRAAGELGYDEARIVAVIAEVEAAYRVDRGRGLVAAAFSEPTAVDETGTPRT